MLQIFKFRPKLRNFIARQGFIRDLRRFPRNLHILRGLVLFRCDSEEKNSDFSRDFSFHFGTCAALDRGPHLNQTNEPPQGDGRRANPPIRVHQRELLLLLSPTADSPKAKRRIPQSSLLD
jgi:hypothetical protein